MAATAGNKWAVEMNVVTANFRKVFTSAQNLNPPNSEDDHSEFKRRKNQLLCSMLSYTSNIISDGVRAIMMEKGEDKSLLFQALRGVEQLQREILQLGDPQALSFTTSCQSFHQEDFRCSNPLVLLLKLAMASRDAVKGRFYRSLVKTFAT